MKNFLKSLALAFSVALPTTSNAVLIEFDTGNLLMDDVFGGLGFYEPTGTFLFDTETFEVSDVDVFTMNAIYVDGVYDENFEAFGLFTTDDLNGLVLDIAISFSNLESEIEMLGVGDSFFIAADPFEFDNDSGDLYGEPVDPGLAGTIVATAVVPVPASLPLLLTGLGGLTLMLRRKKANKAS